jgi:6-phosphogluconolactonase
LKNFELNSFATADELARAVASAWLAEVAVAHQRGTPQSVALSGGRIAKSFFAVVAEQARAKKISLAGVQFFWADERCVPPTDVESNFAIADQLLFQPLAIRADKIHRIRGELAPDKAAELAAAELREFVPVNPAQHPVLDLVFLGMGEDGHVASLFPGEPVAAKTNPAIYRPVTATKPPPHRITLGYDMLANAKQVWVLASGAGKEAALRDSISPTGQTPLARVLQSRRQTKILSDIRL